MSSDPTNRRSVLVTGASSGIGQATARVLASAGFEVFAGVRRLSAESEPNPHLHSVILDVTNAESIDSARQFIETQVGNRGLFAIVNNAGVGDLAPIEFTSVDSLRSVFEVNVFGVVAVTQAFLPLLRQGHGRIVNISSVGGLITVPFGAGLCASKHAVEAISDAFRMELWSSGIPVTMIEPASINSGSAEKIAAKTEPLIASFPPEGRQRYGAMLRAANRTMLKKETDGSSPEVVAEVILKVLNAEHPPARRLAGKDGYLLNFLARFVPTAWRDALLRKALLGNPKFGQNLQN